MGSSRSSSATTISAIGFYIWALFLAIVLLLAVLGIQHPEGVSSHEATSPCDSHHRLPAGGPPPLPCRPPWRHRSRPQPPPSEEEIDLRYGVEKRLVPSGPNPLHN